jgi:tetratricopeptide (TPR) repeat protein
LATAACDLSPEDLDHRATLGIAKYRAKKYEESIATLMNLKANELTGEELFFLSMAHQQAGNEVEAQAYFDKAVAWIRNRNNQDPSLKRLRSEAADLLGMAPTGIERLQPF